MALIERHRKLYEYEKDSNAKMLTMIESVPEGNRNDARFQRAVTLAGHLAACRENWLDSMAGSGISQVAWFDSSCEVATLRTRYAALETAWTTYLAGLDDEKLAKDFEFPDEGGNKWSLCTEVQIEQLCHHASYHRGQIVVLVDQLDGVTVDTDYVYWVWPESA